MLKIHNLKPSSGSKHKKKIVGRGHGSGHGQQSTRGHKGHKARAGYHLVGNFEGGQMSLVRRIPKRGFNNIFKAVITEINLDSINSKFNDGEKVTPETLFEKGLIKKQNCIIKILGRGKIDKKIDIATHLVSKKAKEKIEKSGSKITILKK